jgi:hypothetical protein
MNDFLIELRRRAAAAHDAGARTFEIAGLLGRTNNLKVEL